MTTAIHATAIIDPRATVGPDVTVGAYSVIGPEVVLGAGSEIGHHVVLEGRVVLGARVKVGHSSVLGGEPQDLKYKPGTPSGVRIGEGTVIREMVTIHRATTADAWTEVGPDCLIMGGAHIAHDCRVGRKVIVINYAGITGHCLIDDFATVGGLTGIVPFIRIGAYAYVGGCGKITADVPPCMIAEGLPGTVRGVNVVGLRRAGVTAADRRIVQEAHRILYRSGLTPRRALERIQQELDRTPLIETLVEFLVSARRGICGPPEGWDAEGQDVSDDAERVV